MLVDKDKLEAMDKSAASEFTLVTRLSSGLHQAVIISQSHPVPGGTFVAEPAGINTQFYSADAEVH